MVMAWAHRNCISDEGIECHIYFMISVNRISKFENFSSASICHILINDNDDKTITFPNISFSRSASLVSRLGLLFC